MKTEDNIRRFLEATEDRLGRKCESPILIAGKEYECPTCSDAKRIGSGIVIALRWVLEHGGKYDGLEEITFSEKECR